MAKRKQILNPEKSKQKKALRIPVPPKGGELFKDKKKYTRKRKHKKDFNNE